MFYLYTRGGRTRLAVLCPNGTYGMVTNTASVVDGNLIHGFSICPVNCSEEIASMRACSDPSEASDAGLPSRYVEFMETHTHTASMNSSRRRAAAPAG